MDYSVVVLVIPPYPGELPLTCKESEGRVEQCNAKDPVSPLRVYNGFVLLRLDGDNIAETFYDETGRIAWTPQGGDPRRCKP